MTAQLGTTYTLGLETAITAAPINQIGVPADLVPFHMASYLLGYSTLRSEYVQEVKLSTAVNVRVTMRASDGTGPQAGKTLTVKLAKNGDSSFTTIAPTVTDLGSGVYNVALSTTDTNTLGAASLIVSASGCITEVLRLLVIAIDKADAVHAGLSSLPNAAAEAAGGLITQGAGAGQLTVSGGKANAQVKGMDADTVDANALKADAVAEIQAALPTAASIDTQLTTSHGAGAWTGSGGTADTAAIAAAVVDLLVKTFGVNLPPVRVLSQGVTDPTTRTAIRALENALRQLTGQQ